MMKLNRAKTPPGLWHFPVADGVTLHAINEEKLTAQIYEYRIRNGLPLGNIEIDLDNYYCTRWPEACHKEARDYLPFKGLPGDPPREPMVNRIGRWVSSLIQRMPRGGYALVSTTEAARRANICAGCQFNQPWQLGCPGCTNNTKALCAQVKSLRSTPQDSILFACLHGGWCNDAAVYLSAGELPVHDKAVLPPQCWRKAL